MKLVDKTFAEATQNVALDEALLLTAEQTGDEGGILRIWEPTEWLVVVGRGSSISREVHLERCEQDGLPVFRRSSGGAAIVAGPGCLFYAVILSVKKHPALRLIDQAHAFVLSRLVQGLSNFVPEIQREGISDLTLRGRKVSGNSLRCRKDHVLYHGTLLYDMPLEPLAHYLRFPPRQPDYRESRPHLDFVTNLDVPREVVHRAVRAAWNNPQPTAAWSEKELERLVKEKYSSSRWTMQVP